MVRIIEVERSPVLCFPVGYTGINLTNNYPEARQDRLSFPLYACCQVPRVYGVSVKVLLLILANLPDRT